MCFTNAGRAYSLKVEQGYLYRYLPHYYDNPSICLNCVSVYNVMTVYENILS